MLNDGYPRRRFDLMFGSLGWATMSSGCLVAPSHGLDRLARYQAAAEHGALTQTIAPTTRRDWAFRRLLERFGHIVPPQQPSPA
jgi:hypothetical protein